MFKKHVSIVYSFISDLIKTKDLKNGIVNFDLSSKKKIIIVSLKKNCTNSEIENLGAKFYNQFKNLKYKEFNINSDTIHRNDKNIIGQFLHGLNLKSYLFNKYKTKKNNINFKINEVEKNKPSIKDQINFKEI